MREGDPRARVDAAIEAAKRDGALPLAVLDVDLTLLDNADRTRAIWVDWLHTLRHRWDGAEAAMTRAPTMPIVFGVMDNLQTLGVPQELVGEGLRFWLKHFFDSVYCRRDTPLPGAVDAVRRLLERGVSIAYLTARPAQMLEGTVARFRELGLPVGVPGTILSMKPDFEQPDSAYKGEALAWLARVGRVVVGADNEPGHVNQMVEAFAGAVCAQVDTRHSGGAPPLSPEAWKVPSVKALVS